jgi:hypothetical protein
MRHAPEDLSLTGNVCSPLWFGRCPYKDMLIRFQLSVMKVLPGPAGRHPGPAVSIQTLKE